MDSPNSAIRSAYSTYTEGGYRTPPPDLPSLLLKERIVYLGMPLFPEVTRLIIAELLYLQYDDPEAPINLYINSTGTSYYDGRLVGFETEAFAIADTMHYIKPSINTICIGTAMGMAAMLLSCGTKGHRASLPHASIVLHQPKSFAQGQATDIQIRAKEVLANKTAMLEILARNTGKTADAITRDIDRLLYMDAEAAKNYGLIDRVLESRKDLPAALAATALK